MKQIITEEFVRRCQIKHNNHFDYSLVLYRGCKSLIKIICPIHGVFKQKAYKHLSGNGCPKCTKNVLKTNEEFIQDAMKIHGKGKFDYSKIEYKGARIKVCIICPEHGEFWQTPNDHLNGCGCSFCSGKNKKTTNIFIQESIKVHGKYYIYDKVNYSDIYTKVCIICPEHGEFWQTPNDHLNGGSGCPKCRQSKGERIIEKLLIENNIKFVSQKRFKGCKNKKTLPFDFYIPQFNVCVEYDGVQHFRPINFNGISQEKSKELFLQTQINDRIKNNFCKKQNINLIRIKFDESFDKLQELLC